MGTKPPNQRPCPECGSEAIVRGIGIGQTAEAGRIGLSYRSKGILGLPVIGTSPLLADVCDNCGVIVRLYVQGVGKPWVQRSKAES